MYIEDDDAAFSLVDIILKEKAPDITLFRAGDGDDAMELLLGKLPGAVSLVPDLILLDLNLPKKGGLEILSELKLNDSLRRIPVVMFSTSSAQTDRVSALQRGAQAYINKPSSFDLFVKAVMEACYVPEALGDSRDGPAQSNLV